jgi:hypothetical protein
VKEYDEAYKKQAMDQYETSEKHQKQAREEHKRKMDEKKGGATVEEIVDEEEDAPPLETVDIEEINKNKEL